MVNDIKKQKRALVKNNLPSIFKRINSYLKGTGIKKIKPILSRIGRNHQPPHWLNRLEEEGVLPNLDGKTVGSVVEMLFVADIEANVLSGNLRTTLKINPASGVDVPDLDLGIKSPSENWCTSEPFSNAYERLLGLEYDVVALITNYQDVKETPPLKLQLLHYNYFYGHQIADKGLCIKAKKIRESLEILDEVSIKKAIRFLAYGNQSDWFCKRRIKCIQFVGSDRDLLNKIDESILDFSRISRKSKREIPLEYLQKLQTLKEGKPLNKALINLADDWIVENWKSAAQYPSHGDWIRFINSPLGGLLGVSFALQWRYNFGIYFKNLSEDSD